jgi:hypothetical protein
MAPSRTEPAARSKVVRRIHPPVLTSGSTAPPAGGYSSNRTPALMA